MAALPPASPWRGRSLLRSALLLILWQCGAQSQAAAPEETLVTDQVRTAATESLGDLEVRLSRVAGGTNLIDLRN